MKWLDALNSRANDEAEQYPNETMKWIVSDIENNILSLMQGDVESEDYLENVTVDDTDLLHKIRHHFNEEECVLVEVNESRNKVIKAFKQDLTPII